MWRQSLIHARSSVRYFATTRRGAEIDETQLAAARQWLSHLDAETIPRDVGDVSFSRSSGPGGQNVNKVSTKATLRIPLSGLLPRLPELLHAAVRSSRYVASRSDDLVIQSDDARKQSDNVTSCYRKLHELLITIGREVVPGETSAEQTRHVEQLQKAEAAARRRMKDRQSLKKKSRRGSDE